MLQVQLLLRFASMCVLLRTLMPAPPCAALGLLGDTLWLTERCSSALSGSISATSFGTACFSLLGIVHRNGMNSAPQADFGSYSDSFISVCCPWHGGAIWSCLDSLSVILHCMIFQFLLMKSWAVLEWHTDTLMPAFDQMAHA